MAEDLRSMSQPLLRPRASLRAGRSPLAATSLAPAALRWARVFGAPVGTHFSEAALEALSFLPPLDEEQRQPTVFGRFPRPASKLTPGGPSRRAHLAHPPAMTFLEDPTETTEPHPDRTRPERPAPSTRPGGSGAPTGTRPARAPARPMLTARTSRADRPAPREAPTRGEHQPPGEHRQEVGHQQSGGRPTEAAPVPRSSEQSRARPVPRSAPPSSRAPTSQVQPVEPAPASATAHEGRAPGPVPTDPAPEEAENTGLPAVDLPSTVSEETPGQLAPTVRRRARPRPLPDRAGRTRSHSAPGSLLAAAGHGPFDRLLQSLQEPGAPAEQRLQTLLQAGRLAHVLEDATAAVTHLQAASPAQNSEPIPVARPARRRHEGHRRRPTPFQKRLKALSLRTAIREKARNVERDLRRRRERPEASPGSTPDPVPSVDRQPDGPGTDGRRTGPRPKESPTIVRRRLPPASARGPERRQPLEPEREPLLRSLPAAPSQGGSGRDDEPRTPSSAGRPASTDVAHQVRTASQPADAPTAEPERPADLQADAPPDRTDHPSAPSVERLLAAVDQLTPGAGRPPEGQALVRPPTAHLKANSTPEMAHLDSATEPPFAPAEAIRRGRAEEEVRETIGQLRTDSERRLQGKRVADQRGERAEVDRLLKTEQGRTLLEDEQDARRRDPELPLSRAEKTARTRALRTIGRAQRALGLTDRQLADVEDLEPLLQELDLQREKVRGYIPKGVGPQGTQRRLMARSLLVSHPEWVTVAGQVDLTHLDLPSSVSEQPHRTTRGKDNPLARGPEGLLQSPRRAIATRRAKAKRSARGWLTRAVIGDRAQTGHRSRAGGARPLTPSNTVEQTHLQAPTDPPPPSPPTSTVRERAEAAERRRQQQATSPREQARQEKAKRQQRKREKFGWSAPADLVRRQQRALREKVEERAVARGHRAVRPTPGRTRDEPPPGLADEAGVLALLRALVDRSPEAVDLLDRVHAELIALADLEELRNR